MEDEDTLNQRLDAWAAKLGKALGVEREVADISQILALAGEAARAVARPAAPLTTFMVGYAVGVAATQGRPAPDAMATAATAVRQLCVEAPAR
ncbi:MAG: DUF6457 domain-containing protein [Acidimicrobiales bacterium]